MSEKPKYDYNNPRLPAFKDRFCKLVNEAGGAAEVARVSGISRNTINFWYNGQRTPDAENLITLSRSFGASADWFLGLAPEGNRTDDEEMRAASDFTGLSNQEVAAISKLNDRARHVLGALVQNEAFTHFLDILARAEAMTGLQASVTKRRIQKGIASLSGSASPDDVTIYSLLSEIHDAGGDLTPMYKAQAIQSAEEAFDAYVWGRK